MQSPNPAQELHDLLSNWQKTPPNKPLLQHRAGGDEADWWPIHVRAVMLLEAVTTEVARIQARSDSSIRFADAPLGRIRKAVFFADTSDGASSQSRKHISDEDLTALQMVAFAWGRDDTPVDLGEISKMLEQFQAAEQLITASSNLSAESKDYLLKLLRQVRAAVQDITVYGRVDAQRLVHEFIGAFSVEFSNADGEEFEKAEGLFQRLAKVTKGFFGSPGGAAMIAAGASFIHQLPAG